MVIKVIQTRYKGYHFRSRLEARWAVFFDVAKIKWEYEPEGYVVDGTPYLPDFYLPELCCYFEVKGQPEYDLNFLRRFADEIGCRVVVAEGQIPDPDEWSCLDTIGLQVLRPRHAKASDDYTDDVAWGYKDMFLRCDSCGRISLMNEAYSTMKDNCSCHDTSSRLMPLDDALQAARSARFEHGASGC
jgi:hypothetical protein